MLEADACELALLGRVGEAAPETALVGGAGDAVGVGDEPFEVCGLVEPCDREALAERRRRASVPLA